MGITTDRNDPDLGYGIDTKPRDQHTKYLVLSEEERAKGFIRPVSRTYIHVGKKIERDEEGRLLGRLIKIDEPDYPKNEYYTKEKGYGGYIMYPKNDATSVVGRYIKFDELNAIIERKKYYGGCASATTMGLALSETYARDPKFYGSTYCCACRMHLAVAEFEWEDGEIVGS